jgi:hypothetical protein
LFGQSSLTITSASVTGVTTIPAGVTTLVSKTLTIASQTAVLVMTEGTFTSTNNNTSKITCRLSCGGVLGPTIFSIGPISNGSDTSFSASQIFITPVPNPVITASYQTTTMSGTAYITAIHPLTYIP